MTGYCLFTGISLVVEHILTDNGREYCGRPMVHSYQIFPDFTNIKHHRTKVATPRTNGFGERFNRTILDEFFRETFRNKFMHPLRSFRRTLTGGFTTTTMNGTSQGISKHG